eukprot:scaffold310175_cov19-Tisochrysis_lutea.AAC.1
MALRRAHMSKGSKLADFPEADKAPANTLLETPCDVLIPAALGGVITVSLRVLEMHGHGRRETLLYLLPCVTGGHAQQAQCD